MKYLRHNGTPMPAEEWKKKFGRPPIIEPTAGGPRFSLVEARATDKNAPVTMRVIVKVNGKPADHKRYKLSWRWADGDLIIDLKHENNETFAEPQVQHLGIARPVNHPTLGAFDIVGQPINITEFDSVSRFSQHRQR